MKIDWQARAEALNKRVQREYFEADKVSTLRLALEEAYELRRGKYRVAIVCFVFMALPIVVWFIGKLILS